MASKEFDKVMQSQISYHRDNIFAPEE